LKAASNALNDQKAMDDLADIVAARAINDDQEEKNIKAGKGREVIREEAKQALSRLIKINIKRVIKYDIDPAEYRLETDKTCIHLGVVQNLIEYVYVKRKIAEATGIYIPKYKEEKWKDIAQALLDLCEVIKADEDSSNKGQVRNWLRHYLEHRKPIYDFTDGMLNHYPFFYHEHLYIYGPALRNYLATYWREVISSKAMGLLLTEYGFKSIQVNVKSNNRYVSRSAWIIEIAKDKIAQEYVDMDLLNHATDMEIAAKMEKSIENEAVLQ